MANYIDYTHIEYARYHTSGQSFSEAQQTAITELITQAHGIIKSYLHSEPTSTEGLEAIELELTMRLLWNAEHPDERPLGILTNILMQQLNKEREGEDSSTNSSIGVAITSARSS